MDMIVFAGIVLGITLAVLVATVNVVALFMMFMIANIIGHEDEQGDGHDQT